MEVYYKIAICFVYPLLYLGLLPICLIGAVRTKYKIPFALLSLYSGLYFVFTSLHLIYFLTGNADGSAALNPILDDILTRFCMIIEPIGILAFMSGLFLLVLALIKAQRNLP